MSDLSEVSQALTCRRCFRDITNSKRKTGLCETCTSNYYYRKRSNPGLTIEIFLLRYPIVRVDEEMCVAQPILIAHEEVIPGFIARSPAMRRMFQVIKKVAKTDATVLITGETGVGKELVARALHALSAQQDGLFQVIDCAVLGNTIDLAASELFGHTRGAFTGASTAKIGLFGEAGNGTIFMDEVSSLPLAIQPPFLRVLEQQEYRPLGGTKYVQISARIIAATNQPLNEMVRQGTFRSDLYHRLNVFQIHVPPLRDHKEDIPALAKHFLSQKGYEWFPIDDRTIDVLWTHHWPGNVRELKNVLARALIMRDNEHAPLTTKDFPREIFL